MTQQEREVILALAEVAARVRRIDPEMPLQAFQTFLLVAARESMQMADLGDALDLSGSATSRNVAVFTSNKGGGVPGHRLLSAHEDPLDRRRRIVRNTKASHKLALELVDILRAPFERAQAAAARRQQKED